MLQEATFKKKTKLQKLISFSAEVTAGKNESSNGREFTDPWQKQFQSQVAKKSKWKRILVLSILYRKKKVIEDMYIICYTDLPIQ